VLISGTWRVLTDGEITGDATAEVAMVSESAD
jgi:hypothetical protein